MYMLAAGLSQVGAWVGVSIYMLAAGLSQVGAWVGASMYMLGGSCQLGVRWGGRDPVRDKMGGSGAS